MEQTANQISKANSTPFSEVAKQQRIDAREKFSLLSKEEKKQIRDLYVKDGLSMQKICEMKSISYFILYRVLKKTLHHKRQKSIREFAANLAQLSPEDKGYLAGLLDGEGCLNVNLENDKGKKRYRVSIAIANCDEKIMKYVFDTLKANVLKNRVHKFNRNYSHKRRHKNWLPLFEWRLSDKKLLKPLLTEMLPLVKGKRREIEFMLQMIECKSEEKKYDIYLALRKEKAKKNLKVVIPNTGGGN